MFFSLSNCSPKLLILTHTTPQACKKEKEREESYLSVSRDLELLMYLTHFDDVLLDPAIPIELSLSGA